MGKRYLLVPLSAVAVLLAAASASAEIITVTDVVVSGGVVNGNTDTVLGNGAPVEGMAWNTGGESTLWWNGAEPTLTLSFGGVYQLQEVTLSVDCNDDYRVQYSLDDSSWTTLFTVTQDQGETFPGMDTMSSVLGNAEYIAQIDFAPVLARSVRIYAVGGDTLNAVGELRFEGVPEPSSLALLAAGVAGVLYRRRRVRA